MLGKAFRPWGHLSWILDRTRNSRWCLLGCLSTEERCLGAWHIIKSRKQDGESLFFQIEDPPSKFTAKIRDKLASRKEDYKKLGGNIKYIEDHQLFEKYDIFIQRAKSFIASSNGNIIIDLSSLPKRYFFPIVKIILKSPDVRNFIATYTIPRTYSSDALAEDHEKGRYLPLFAPQQYPDRKIQVIIVGVGFVQLGISDLLESFRSDAKIKLLFPFPPGPPSFQRTWGFLRNIDQYIDKEERNCRPVFVDVKDASDSFDYICSATDNGNIYGILAPYGPKPMSLAMCIFAANTGIPVYYSQPKVYNPDYCIGVKDSNGVPETYAYCIRLEGRDYYSV